MGTWSVSISLSMWTPSLWLESPQISLKFEWFLRPLGLKGQLPLTLCFPQSPLEISGSCSGLSSHPAWAPLYPQPQGLGDSSCLGKIGLLQDSPHALLALHWGAAAHPGTSLRGLQPSASHPSSLLTLILPSQGLSLPSLLCSADFLLGVVKA